MIFTTETEANRMVIHCPREMSTESVVIFKNEMKAWMLLPVELFVLDFQLTRKISRDFYPVIIQLKTVMKRDNKNLISLSLSEALRMQVQSEGLEPVFNPQKSLPPASTTPKPKAVLPVELINPFLNAVIKTLDVQCSMKASAGKPVLRGEAVPTIAIASVLALSSKGFSGTLVIGFPKTVFLKVYESMLGESQTDITEETQDAAAELLNIIYGLAKVELNLIGHTFDRALPTVVVGEGLRVRQNSNVPAVQIPFTTEHGTFFVGIEFNQSLERKVA